MNCKTPIHILLKNLIICYFYRKKHSLRSRFCDDTVHFETFANGKYPFFVLPNVVRCGRAILYTIYICILIFEHNFSIIDVHCCVTKNRQKSSE